MEHLFIFLTDQNNKIRDKGDMATFINHSIKLNMNILITKIHLILNIR